MTLLGGVKKKHVLTRRGAQPDDVLFVSGPLGGAAAGLALLREGARLAADGRVEGAPAEVPSAAAARALRASLDPDPPLRLATALARARIAHAMIDVSDGLADAVAQLATASGVGARIEAGAVPVDEAARHWAQARGRAPLDLALAGGEDYELVLAVPPRHARRMGGLARGAHHAPLARIGTMTAAR